jgi:hypothetical protein
MINFLSPSKATDKPLAGKTQHFHAKFTRPSVIQELYDFVGSVLGPAGTTKVCL